jgi:hypothetical protein
MTRSPVKSVLILSGDSGFRTLFLLYQSSIELDAAGKMKVTVDLPVPVSHLQLQVMTGTHSGPCARSKHWDPRDLV